MKPTFKLVALLGVLVVAGSTTLWLCRPHGQPRQVAAVTPQTIGTNLARAAIPRASAKPGKPPVAPDAVPESVRSIVAAPAITFAARVKAVRALPANLAPQEIHALHAYLLTPASSSAEDREQENWLRNELLDKLADAAELPAELAGVLVAIYQDPAQDIVMRDYAVQHVTPVYARTSAEEKATLQQILWSAVAETDSSLAGTALLALRDLATDHREIQANKLGEAALKLAGDTHCGELSRITAFQLCARLGLTQAAPLLLQQAQMTESVPLQLAAIAALGDVGNAEARTYLRQLAVQPEPRLRPALDTALKKLNQRLGI